MREGMSTLRRNASRTWLFSSHTPRRVFSTAEEFSCTSQYATSYSMLRYTQSASRTAFSKRVFASPAISSASDAASLSRITNSLCWRYAGSCSAMRSKPSE